MKIKVSNYISHNIFYFIIPCEVVFMTKIRYSIEDGHINIDISGHAGYAPAGFDIVCSAISAVTQTALLGLEAIADSYPQYVDIKQVDPNSKEVK